VTQVLAIATGGAIGALMRYWVSMAVYSAMGRNFPYGTLAVNVLGSLLMGILFVFLVERMAADSIWRAALLIGVLGAFTTYSTFSIETLNLIEEGAYNRAMVNIGLSVVLSLAAAWLGMKLGRQF